MVATGTRAATVDREAPARGKRYLDTELTAVALLLRRGGSGTRHGNGFFWWKKGGRGNERQGGSKV